MKKKLIYATLFCLLSHTNAHPKQSLFDQKENKTLCTSRSALDPTKKILSLKHVKAKDWSLSGDFMCELTKLFGANIFVETGTFRGDTAYKASKYFEEVHTIELSKRYYQGASKRFKNNKNVHIYQGDSSIILPEILPNIEGKILFWLDGHYSEGTTAKGKKNTPVVEELQAIRQSGIKDAIILIDDIRCFQKVKNIPKNASLMGYPTVSELEQLVLKIDRNYQFKIFGDMAIAYPVSTNITVSPVVQACTISRLSEDKETDSATLFKAEKTIAKAQGEEQEAIKKLYESFLLSANRHGIAKHYFLWYGLILLEKNNTEKARELLLRATNLGLTHPRVSQYLKQAPQ